MPTKMTRDIAAQEAGIVLRVIDGPRTPADLRRRTGLHTIKVARALSSLEREGRIVDVSDPEDMMPVYVRTKD